MSTTTAPATRNSGVQAASVRGATMTSPGSRAAAAVRSFTTRGRPVYVPALAPTPGEPGAAAAAARPGEHGAVRRRALRRACALPPLRERWQLVGDDERRLELEEGQ